MARKVSVEIVGDSRPLERAFARSSRSAQKFERSVAHAGRGIASGTGLFKGFARSLAFASGGFVAFESATAFLRASVDAARDAAVAQRSLGAQMKTSGESFATHKEQIDKLSVSYAKFGFQNDEVIKSLTILERGTGKINTAMRLQQLAADIARAKNIDLAAAATTVAKVFGGQETALRRAVPGLSKTAHGWDLIREAQRKVAGQAAANTTAAERFQAALHDTEEIIGQALLPTLNRYLDQLTKWLQNTNNQKQLADDVKQAMDVLTIAIDGAVGAMRLLNRATKIYLGLRKELTSGGAFGLGKLSFLVQPLPKIFQDEVARGRKIAEYFGLVRDDAGGAASALKDAMNYAKAGAAAVNAVTGAAAAGAAAGRLGRRRGLLGKPPTFDDQLARRLDRLQDTTLRKQLVGLHQLEAIIRNRVKEARTIRGRLKLQDQLVEILRQEKDVTGQISDANKAAVQQERDRAKAAAERRREAAQRRRDLIEERQQRFLETGLTFVPGIKRLKRELVQVRHLLGSTIDPQTRTRLNRIASILAGHLGKVGKAMRESIKSELDGLRRDVDKGTTRIAQVVRVNTGKMLAGLGLTPQQRQALRGRLSQIGPGGSVSTSTAAFAGAHGGVVITGDVHVHGVQNIRQFEDEMARRHKSRAHVRRGL